MIVLDGYKLASWIQPTQTTPWRRDWKHIRGLRPTIIGIEVRGAAPHVTWSARLPDGTVHTGTAAKAQEGKRAADAWIKEQIAKRAPKEAA